MIESNKCPICGKEGIPDFRKEDLVCPCCNTDLSVYHKIDKFAKLNRAEQASYKKHKWPVYFLGIIVIVLIGICFWVSEWRNRGSENDKIISLELEIFSLKDSIDQLNQKIELSHSSIEEGNKKDNYLPEKLYVVKQGDSFCKISKNLLGDESRYMEIINLNNLNVSTVLHKGDTLKIPVQ